jgi:hypothetical protein
MKFKNKINPKISIILFICLFALLLIPILFEITGYKENMTDYVNFTDYNTIDRIQVKDTDTDTYNYSYCIGGNVKCKSSTASPIEVAETDYNQGKTYKSKCDDGDDIICTDNLFNSVVSYNLSSYTLPGGTSFPLSNIYKGFTSPYNYVPAEMDSSNNINILNDSKTIQERIHKCNLLSYEHQGNCYNKFFTGGTNNASNEPTQTSESSQTTSSPSSPQTIQSTVLSNDGTKCNNSIKIPCIADFGTNIGDDLCCGQTGVLQNTKYVCPITRPKCSNFKCGSQFGNCE